MVEEIMDTGEKIRVARKRAGLTQKALGLRVGASLTTIHEVETSAHKGGLPRELLVRLAHALDAPDLLAAYCEDCPVCNALIPTRFPQLDNVPLHPTTVVAKGEEEAREAVDAFHALFGLFGRNDWAEHPERVEQVTDLLIQVRDVEVNIRVLYDVLFVRGLLPMSVLEEVHARQADKCESRGYCRNGTHG